jgi:hypothetical protein
MKYDITELKRNRILDIVLNYTSVPKEEFFGLRNKKKYASIRNVSILLMYTSGVHYEDIAKSLGMSVQNVYYQVRVSNKWGEFETELFNALKEEIKNEQSELSLY